MKGEREQWLSEVRGKSGSESCYWLRLEKIRLKAVMCLSEVVIVNVTEMTFLGISEGKSRDQRRVNHVLSNTVNAIKLVDY